MRCHTVGVYLNLTQTPPTFYSFVVGGGGGVVAKLPITSIGTLDQFYYMWQSALNNSSTRSKVVERRGDYGTPFLTVSQLN